MGGWKREGLKLVSCSPHGWNNKDRSHNHLGLSLASLIAALYGHLTDSGSSPGAPGPACCSPQFGASRLKVESCSALWRTGEVAVLCSRIRQVNFRNENVYMIKWIKIRFLFYSVIEHLYGKENKDTNCYSGHLKWPIRKQFYCQTEFFIIRLLLPCLRQVYVNLFHLRKTFCCCNCPLVFWATKCVVKKVWVYFLVVPEYFCCLCLKHHPPSTLTAASAFKKRPGNKIPFSSI